MLYHAEDLEIEPLEDHHWFLFCMFCRYGQHSGLVEAGLAVEAGVGKLSRLMKLTVSGLVGGDGHGLHDKLAGSW